MYGPFANGDFRGFCKCIHHTVSVSIVCDNSVSQGGDICRGPG